MTILYRAAQAMTVIMVVTTIHQALFGDRFGVVLVGWAVSTFGIIVCATCDPREAPHGD